MLRTIGELAPLIPPDMLEKNLPHLMEVIMQQYDYQIEPFFVTEACRTSNGGFLKTETNDLVVKSLMTLANHSMDTVLKVVYEKAERGSDEECCTALRILRNLICQNKQELKEQRSKIMNCIQTVLTARSREVTDGPLGHVISTMVYFEYIDHPKGQMLIEYLVRHCVSPAIKDEYHDETIQHACLASLEFVGSSCTHITHILWAQLLFYICSPSYNNALIPVCTSLANLTTRKLKQEGISNFLKEVHTNENLPSPQALLLRFLIISRSLKKGGRQASEALKLLHVLRPLIHHCLKPYWKEAIPKLLNKLERFEDLKRDKWETLMLEEFLDGILQIIRAHIYSKEEETEKENEKSSEHLGIQVYPRDTPIGTNFVQEGRLLVPYWIPNQVPEQEAQPYFPDTNRNQPNKKA
ncbi:hypothetical protein NDU88_004979 [Pleurodeles waltl]|uniref:MROH2B-like HEAT-repeats domain-containing protein n=1 Tax=Pleurodeles waltl TaxID=8319 RepID=A0AAV7VLW5_PLEWA|nr:hypothetical protein NDU88_004979 [Pleurodeles waltl]